MSAAKKTAKASSKKGLTDMKKPVSEKKLRELAALQEQIEAKRAQDQWAEMHQSGMKISLAAARAARPSAEELRAAEEAQRVAFLSHCPTCKCDKASLLEEAEFKSGGGLRGAIERAKSASPHKHDAGDDTLEELINPAARAKRTPKGKK